MDPDAARTLFTQRAFLILQGLLRGSHITLDLHAAITDSNFEGFKFVPTGVHCFTWQSAGASDEAMASTGLRNCTFFYTKGHQVVLRQYDPSQDAFQHEADLGGELLVSEDHMRTLDPHLAPYTGIGVDTWTSITRYLATHASVLARVFAVNLASADPCCDSFTPVASQGPGSDVFLEPPTEMPALHFTAFTLQHSWPPEAQGEERTKWSVDKSWLLEDVLERAAVCLDNEPLYTALLCEVELSFVLFLQANNAEALAYWVELLTLFSRASSRLGAPGRYELHPCEWDDTMRTSTPLRVPQLDAHIAYIRTLAAQFAAMPPTIWTEELSTAEARVLKDLAQLRANIARALGTWAALQHEPNLPTPPYEQLLAQWRAMANTCVTRFGWTLDTVLDEEVEADELEEEDDAPVVVELQTM
ncbi:hypothetical protein MVES1_002715 [Malassezia vespertilionis]|uniref:uncharacterized protein n=1 Tax=Malassezia vespertilionis TaxID=2020962 RepID=UPI0024B2378B|nr:uncharacterized protein MVES1_002715 [Malassezia vespertilionis]WFD07352.1 hypothetical protein MVES1_002715 [Malassezia vespertilionis]